MATSGFAASHHVVKAGWMQRESDILKRWKKCYCVLKTNGLLSFYNNETMTEHQGTVNLPRDCFVLQVAYNVQGVTPPQGYCRGGLIEIRSSQAAHIFCAESADDAQTWKLVFDDVIRRNRAAPNPPAAPNTYVVNAPPPYAAVAVPPAQPPPTVYVQNALPAYAVTPQPVTVINPGSTSRVTSTTYYPNGQQTVTVRRGASNAYPVQQTVYSYPGQTIITPGAGGVTTYQVPNQSTSTTTVYRTQYY